MQTAAIFQLLKIMMMVGEVSEMNFFYYRFQVDFESRKQEGKKCLLHFVEKFFAMIQAERTIAEIRNCRTDFNWRKLS